MRTPSDKQKKALDELKKISPEADVHWDEKTGTPSRIRGQLSDSMKGNPESVALMFLENHKVLFGLKKPSEELQLKKINVDEAGNRHIRFQQKYHDTQVFRCEIIVHLGSDNVVNGTDANLAYIEKLPDEIKISAREAQDKAMHHAGSRNAAYQWPPELTVLVRDGMPSLTWKVLVPGTIEKLLDSDKQTKRGNKPAMWVYFVDAQTGSVLWQYNALKSHGITTGTGMGRYAGNVTIDTIHSHTNNNYMLIDRDTGCSARISIYDCRRLTNGCRVATDRDNSWNSANQRELVDSMYHTRKVFDYFRSVFRRNSYDDACGDVKIHVHYGVDLADAFFYETTEAIYLGDGDALTLSPLCDLDIIAHEFTHGVSYHEVGFIYENDSGAIDESFSDLFSCLIGSDWLVGEDIWLPPTAQAMRDIADPSKSGDPLAGHMNQIYTGPDQDIVVHYNSGILSHAGYMIAVGGTYNSVNVCEGLGRDMLARLLYNAYNHLLSTSTFTDMRQAMLDSLDDLFATSPLYNRWQAAINNAYAAVGIGNAVPCPPI